MVSPLDQLRLFQHISSGQYRWYPQSYALLPEIAADLRSVGIPTSGVESRRNKAKNPAAAVGTGWSQQTGGATWATTLEATGGPLDGPATWYRMVATTANTTSPVGVNGSATATNGVEVSELTTYTISGFFYSEVASGLFRMNVVWYNAAGASIGGEVSGTSDSHDGGGWRRVSSVLTSPAGAAYVRPLLRMSTSAGAYQPGATIGATGILVEAVSTLDSYFDGSYPSSLAYYYAWTGAANASESQQLIIMNTTGLLDIPKEPPLV